MKQIQILTIEQFSQIYQQHIIYDFPENERRPLENIRWLMQEGQYLALGYYDKQCLLGYATLYQSNHIDLLDYFAIVKDYRNQHLGTTFLNELLAQYKNKPLLLEVENPQIEPTPQKTRRMDFYLRQHLISLNINIYLFFVNYTLLANQPLTLQEIQTFYANLYQEPLYSQYIQFQKDEI